MAVPLGQIRKGMRVHTSDGTELGEIKAMWPGIDPTSASVRCDEEVCSRIEVRHGKGRRARTLYIPYNAVAGITNEVVTLKMGVEVANAKGWARRPGWLPRKVGILAALGYGQQQQDHILRSSGRGPVGGADGGF